MTAMLDTIHALEDDIAAILATVDLALSTLADDDPLRSDLEEIRCAARLAVARTETLAVRTSAAGEVHGA